MRGAVGWSGRGTVIFQSIGLFCVFGIETVNAPRNQRSSGWSAPVSSEFVESGSPLAPVAPPVAPRPGRGGAIQREPPPRPGPNGDSDGVGLPREPKVLVVGSAAGNIDLKMSRKIAIPTQVRMMKMMHVQMLISW